MNFLLHPRRSFRALTGRSQNKKCVVQTDYPPMVIKGKSYLNKVDDPNFPTYIAFFGIPYAERPVKSLRFKPPQPLRSTRKPRVIRAYNPKHACLQYIDEDNSIGKEDCLYLNIYLPMEPEHIITKLPVLIYIHGGGFDHGSGDFEFVRPDCIIRQNLIFVTINYRLNVYGFLNLGTEDCRGNAGLKDQVLAMRWVKDNIDRFGGDPDNITISGNSAGGSCVNLHMISPLSKGLFHKAIVSSGGMYCPFGLLKNQNNVKKLFARAMYHTDATKALVHVLRKRSAIELLYITQEINNNLIQLQPYKLSICMGPTVEPIQKDAFIPYDVEQLRKEAEPVPLMAGICQGEGYMHIIGRLDDYPEGFKAFVNDDKEFLYFLMDNFDWSERTARKHIRTIRNTYFRYISCMTEKETARNFAMLNTDIWFRRFYDNFKLGEEAVPFYIYKFCYLASNNCLRQTLDQETKFPVMTAVHGDDLTYLFMPRFLKKFGNGKIEEDCRNVMNNMCQLWAKFCMVGDFESSIFHEDIEWKHHTDTEPRYLRITETLRMVSNSVDEGRWEKLNEIAESVSRNVSPIDSPKSSHKMFHLERNRSGEDVLGIFNPTPCSSRSRTTLNQLDLISPSY